jgi:ethanolamine utilization protein EutA
VTHVPWHPDESEKLEELYGVESVELLSVGIDVGTTTTQLMFSRMVARRRGGDHASKFRVEDRETVYKSSIALTPYEDEEGNTIDVDGLEAHLMRWYDDAGYRPADVDTGAVIITGEACRAENAEPIIDLFSEQSGRFVCATAGANLETLMAAHGSGAVDYSVDTDQNVLHVDVGGGTTKLAYIVSGFVEETASINVGARLVAFDDQGRVTRVEDAARTTANDIGLSLALGESLSEADRERLASRFAELFFSLIDGEPEPLARELMVTAVPEQFPFDVLTFSGGGAEYIYGRESGFYDDLGPQLGEAIRSSVNARNYNIAELDPGIRATAVGSTQHTVQVSGNTITITDESLLPLRNVTMVPFVADHHDKLEELTQAVVEKLDLYDVDRIDGPVALGFHLHGLPEHTFLSTIIDAAIEGWRHVGSPSPLVLAFDSDVAMNAGRLAEKRVDDPVVAVDGVELDQFGYVDVGELLEETNAVPLTIKSLVFEG